MDTNNSYPPPPSKKNYYISGLSIYCEFGTVVWLGQRLPTWGNNSKAKKG